jgi:hypothetical protein
MEVLGGDLQFSHSGLYSPEGTFMTQTGNVRWQYAVLDNIYLSRIEAGQISTRGPNSRAIRGVSLTNDPIESRDLYGTYVLDGRTEPDSEIELYQNNQLVSYLRADEIGYYRFDVPLLYGTTSLRTRIYTPNGDLIEDDRQIQVPFVFLPRGVAAYSVQAGQIAASFDERTEGEIAAHGKFGIGLTKWLTANVGAEYSTFGGEAPKMYTSASARLFDSYLVNVDAVPYGFVRTQTSVVFPTSQSISLNHTWFDGTTEYNTRGAQQQIQVNVYTPLPFRKLGAGFRLGADHIVYPFRQETALNSDLFFRAGPVSLRLNHRENLVTVGRDIDPTSGFLAKLAAPELAAEAEDVFQRAKAALGLCGEVCANSNSIPTGSSRDARPQLAWPRSTHYYYTCYCNQRYVVTNALFTTFENSIYISLSDSILQ